MTTQRSSIVAILLGVTLIGVSIYSVARASHECEKLHVIFEETFPEGVLPNELPNVDFLKGTDNEKAQWDQALADSLAGLEAKRRVSSPGENADLQFSVNLFVNLQQMVATIRAAHSDYVTTQVQAAAFGMVGILAVAIGFRSWIRS